MSGHAPGCPIPFLLAAAKSDCVRCTAFAFLEVMRIADEYLPESALPPDLDNLITDATAVYLANRHTCAVVREQEAM